MISRDEYLFRWEKISENDKVRLKAFLRQNFNIEWVNSATIEKVNDDKTIKVSAEKNSLSLTLNDDKTSVYLELDDGRTDQLIVKTKNGNLNIYTDDKIKVKFYILCVAGRVITDYDVISEAIRKEIDEKLIIHSFKKNEPLQNVNESWYIWHSRIPIRFKDSVEDCAITIKHFKVRIIIEITRKYKQEEFADIFRVVRKERDEIIKNNLIDNLLSIKIPGIVEQIYSFPLVQIFKEYKSKDFDKIDDENETISSFLYEVPDARRETLGSILFAEPKKTLIRVSRPSIIATEMSPFMLSQIINSIYDTWLHSLRTNKTTEASDETFHNMRDYIGRVLFDHEETVANVEMTRSVNTLSIIMSIGAIATILTIILYITDLVKAVIGLFLLVFTIIIVVLFIISKRYR